MGLRLSAARGRVALGDPTIGSDREHFGSLAELPAFIGRALRDLRDEVE